MKESLCWKNIWNFTLDGETFFGMFSKTLISRLWRSNSAITAWLFPIFCSPHSLTYVLAYFLKLFFIKWQALENWNFLNNYLLIVIFIYRIISRSATISFDSAREKRSLFSVILFFSDIRQFGWIRWPVDCVIIDFTMLTQFA